MRFPSLLLCIAATPIALGFARHNGPESRMVVKRKPLVHHAIHDYNIPRALTDLSSTPGGGASQTSAAGPTSSDPVTPPPSPTSAPPTSSESSISAPSSPPPVDSATPPPSATSQDSTVQSTSSPSSQSLPTSPPPTQLSTTPPQQSTQVVQTTNSQGSLIQITITVTNSVVQSKTGTSTSASASSTAGGGGGDTGVSNSTIIGLSVAGGIGVLGIVAFVIWKLKKKRFSDFDDDDGNAIKWPELDGAAAMHPLPARPTGRAGVETNALDRSESDLFDARSIAASSTADLAVHPAPAPYSQPIPAQQYYDDPSYAQHDPSYYDPYRGPVPQTFTSPPGSTDEHGQPYPVHNAYRSQSPGPAAAYGGEGGEPVYGGGRMSPGPGPAYGTRSPSPGPNLALAGGIPARNTPSPGPAMAYGQRSGSPGPHQAYGGNDPSGQGYR